MTFNVNAQTKPTKGETIAFIQRTLQLSVGQTSQYKNTPVRTITAYDFNYDQIVRTTFLEGRNSDMSEMITEIKWETLNSVEIHQSNPDGWKMENTSVVGLTFSSKCKENADVYTNSFGLIILKSKAESVKKACLRLSEIAKEENKDPFKD